MQTVKIKPVFTGGAKATTVSPVNSNQLTTQHFQRPEPSGLLMSCKDTRSINKLQLLGNGSKLRPSQQCLQPLERGQGQIICPGLEKHQNASHGTSLGSGQPVSSSEINKPNLWGVRWLADGKGLTKPFSFCMRMWPWGNLLTLFPWKPDKDRKSFCY